VTVELSDAAGGTELRLRHEQLPSEESRDNHNDGWKSLLNKLDQFLSREGPR
jgi:glutathione S-transferase